MAVNRWFFGIPAFANYWEGPTWYTASDKDTYIVGFKMCLSEATNGGAVWVFAKPVDTTKNPGSLGGVAVLYTGLQKAVGCAIDLQNICIPVQASSLLQLYMSLPGATTIYVELTIVELPQNTIAVAGTNAPREAVMRQAYPTRVRVFRANYTASGATTNYLNMTVNNNLVVQPLQQSTPAVADELNVVSTSAADDGSPAGVGARTIKFDYWDSSYTLHENAGPITLDGTTPVNIVATYADVYLIKRAWVATVGSALVNAGHILFQDNA